MIVRKNYEDETKQDAILTKVSEYKGIKYVDIRLHYLDNGVWKPTKRGVTIRKKEAFQFLDEVKDAIRELMLDSDEQQVVKNESDNENIQF